MPDDILRDKQRSLRQPDATDMARDLIADLECCQPKLLACPHCNGSGRLETTLYGEADAGPCGECDATGWGNLLDRESVCIAWRAAIRRAVVAEVDVRRLERHLVARSQGHSARISGSTQSDDCPYPEDDGAATWWLVGFIDADNAIERRRLEVEVVKLRDELARAKGDCREQIADL